VEDRVPVRSCRILLSTGIFFKNFLMNNKIKSVLDIGCGDWQLSRLID
jgi:hypothetical protein